MLFTYQKTYEIINFELKGKSEVKFKGKSVFSDDFPNLKTLSLITALSFSII